MIEQQHESGTAGIREVHVLLDALRREIEVSADRHYESLLAIVTTNHAEVMVAVRQLQAQTALVKFVLSLWRPKVALAVVGAVVGTVGGWFGFKGAEDMLMKLGGPK